MSVTNASRWCSIHGPIATACWFISHNFNFITGPPFMTYNVNRNCPANWAIEYFISLNSVQLMLIETVKAKNVCAFLGGVHWTQISVVLAPPGLCVQWLVSQCLLIVPNSSLQDRHAFAVDKEPSSLVYNWNEDSFNHAMSIITHYALHLCTLSDDCSKLLTTGLARLCYCKN